MGGLNDISNPRESTPLASPVLRQRAPTITIDHSDISSPTPVVTPNHEPSPSHSQSFTQHQRSLSIENRPLLSFGSRPASPQNITSPTLKKSDKTSNPHNLLTVPSTRSRGSSLNHAHSISSYGGETLVSTPTQSSHNDSHGESSEAMSHGLGNNDPLKADPEEEHRFHVEDNPFAFSPRQLSKLFNPKSLAAFCALGELQSLVLGLRTDRSGGLSLDETTLEGTVEFDKVTARTSPALPRKGCPSLAALSSTTSRSISHTTSERYVDRKRVFGISHLPKKKSKNLLQIMWMTFNNKVLSLYADEGSPAALSGDITGRPPLMNSGCAAAHSLVARWVSTCVRDHEDCRNTKSGVVIDEGEEPFLPTRIIDVGSSNGLQAPRLVETRC